MVRDLCSSDVSRIAHYLVVYNIPVTEVDKDDSTVGRTEASLNNLLLNAYWVANLLGWAGSALNRPLYTKVT